MSQFGLTRQRQNERMRELRTIVISKDAAPGLKQTALAEIKALKKQMLVKPVHNVFKNVAYMKWRHEKSHEEYLARVEAEKPPVLDFTLPNRAEAAAERRRSMSEEGIIKILPNKADMLSAVNFVKAAGDCDIVTMRALLKKGVAVNCVDPLTGRAALHEAAAEGHEKALRLLFERECDTNSRTVLGRESALHLAASNGHHRACRLLLRRGCEVDNFNNVGNAPIHHAGSTEVVNVLVNYGSKPSMKNKCGKTAMETIDDKEVVASIEAALEEEYRADFQRKREKRAVFEAAQKALWESEREKQLEDDKRRQKREYMHFRHQGAIKKKTKSVFSDAADDGLFDYERRIPRR